MDSTNNYINKTDLDRIIQAVPEIKIRKWETKDVQFLFKLLYYCALRPMEGIMLSRSDFNLNDRYIKLKQTKTEFNIQKTIPTIFMPEVEKYLRTKLEGRLLPDLKYITFYFWLKKLGKICNIEAWTTSQLDTKEKTVGHGFRKSFGKACLFGEILDKNGDEIPLTIISKHLGHKTIEMTYKYIKAAQAQVSQTL